MGTALPSIVHDLHGTDSFAWVSAAYTLSTTAVLPLNGRLAEIFGRRDVLLFGLVLFAVGSAVCASSQTMTILIVGRGKSIVFLISSIDCRNYNSYSRPWLRRNPDTNHYRGF